MTLMDDSPAIEMTEARKQISTFDMRLKSDKVLRVTKHGKDAFAVVNVDFLEAALETIEILSDQEAAQAYRDSLEDIRKGRLVSHEDVLARYA